jgi:hypothetical protein
MSEQRRCDIPCDDDCEAGCHQLHLPRHKRHPSACHCGYQQRVADAAMQAWNERALVCEHAQRVPIGELVDAVLAVPNPELERLRTLLAEKSAEVDDKSDVGHAVADAWMARAERAEAAVARSNAALASFEGRGINNLDIPTLAEVLDAWRASLTEEPTVDIDDDRDWTLDELAERESEPPDEWLLAAAIEAYNDGRDQLADFTTDELDYLSDGLAAVIPLVRAEQAAEVERLRGRLAAYEEVPTHEEWTVTANAATPPDRDAWFYTANAALKIAARDGKQAWRRVVTHKPVVIQPWQPNPFSTEPPF